MLIDHLVYAVPDLEVAVDDLERRSGVRPAGGGRHPVMGTRNRLLGLGPHTYLEVIAPDPEQPDPEGARPYGLDDLTCPALVGWALACDDIQRARSMALARGYDLGDLYEAHRVTPDGTTLRWRVTSNESPAGEIPFLISWGDTPHPTASAPAGLALTSFRVEHPDPDSLVTPFAAVDAAVEVRLARQPALVARIDSPRGSIELR
ncbi:VOC family protein [Nocardioides guangzhouensis]|uniref:VOC family protein n=1 Tax=Nocardioides guangzhouensis TaxID=2497878 RepID=A0A4Q4ZKG1_9ACTN|nr:VOC family protein [Nocardioides guangzhouensis]RYP88887.1 VOC family protein [Nocardioides guangzhouensis]